MRDFRIFGCGLVLALAALTAGGCASVQTVSERAGPAPIKVRRPAQIWVQPFNTDDGMWQQDASAPEKRLEVRDWLTGRLLRHLSSLAPTHLYQDDGRTSGWLVTGRFLRVNPGSRMGRMFLGGIGVGASRLETRVDVYDLAVSTTDPIMSFTTTGGSNLAAGIPGAMAATDDDVDRTAREIREYLEKHLWPADDDESMNRPAAIEAVPVGPRR